MQCRLQAMAALAAIVVSAPAEAQTVSPNDAKSVLSALQAKGLSATLGSAKSSTLGSSQRDPIIHSVSEGVRFSVAFVGCSGARGCSGVEFISAYGTSTIMNPAKVAAWNQRHLDARIILSLGGQPSIRHSVYFPRDTMTAAEFGARIDYWLKLLPEFRKAATGA